MITATRAVTAGLLAVLLARPISVHADETDNFTCRSVPLRDALAAADGWVSARLDEAVAEAAATPSGCDDECLARALRTHVGASQRRRWTWIPHARLARWIERQPGIDRCHLAFADSIYGARPYHRPWLLPFTGRVIYLADSVRLAGRVVGVDKVNHFIREGLAHWRDVHRGHGGVETVLRRELGPPRRQLRMTEYGLKGWSLTGVASHADLAASYAGYRFWDDLLSLGRPGSYVARDRATGRVTRQRHFTFADYVTDAWDEGVNCSTFHPGLGAEVRAALDRRALACPVTDCRHLATLPHASLYVSPACLADAPAP